MLTAPLLAFLNIALLSCHGLCVKKYLLLLMLLLLLLLLLVLSF